MTIQEFYQATGGNDTTLGFAVGRSAASIGNVRRGDSNAGLSLIVRIVQASDGRIDPYTIPMSASTRQDVDAWIAGQTPIEQRVPVEMEAEASFAQALERAR